MKKSMKPIVMILVVSIIAFNIFGTYSCAAVKMGTYENSTEGNGWRCVRIMKASNKSITFKVQCYSGMTPEITAAVKGNKVKFTCKGVKKKAAKLSGTLKISSNKVILKIKGNDALSTNGKSVTLRKVNSDSMF